MSVIHISTEFLVYKKSNFINPIMTLMKFYIQHTIQGTSRSLIKAKDPYNIFNKHINLVIKATNVALGKQKGKIMQYINNLEYAVNAILSYCFGFFLSLN